MLCFQPSCIEVCFGTNIGLFEYILKCVGPHFDAGCLSQEGKTKEKTGAPRTFDAKQAQALWLQYLLFYLPESLLAIQWKTSQRTVESILDAYTSCFLKEFNSTGNSVIHVPSREERDQSSIYIWLPNGNRVLLAALIDGTLQEVEVPSGE